MKEKDNGKKKAKENKKKSENRKPVFAYEEFLELNNIEIAELPDYIQTMIQTISKQLSKSRKNCTPTHYKIVKKKLQAFADIVEDFLMDYYDQKLANNIIKEKEFEEHKELAAEIKKSKEIIDLAEHYGRTYLLSSELKLIGVEGDYSGKEIIVDHLRLERELTTSKWYLGINQNYKGGSI